MDTEFVEYLDGKFREVGTRFNVLEKEFEKTREEIREIKSDVAHLQQSLDNLTTSVDRFVKLHEDVVTEQATMRADISRIKDVLREKLGVEL